MWQVALRVQGVRQRPEAIANLPDPHPPTQVPKRRKIRRAHSTMNKLSCSVQLRRPKQMQSCRRLLRSRRRRLRKKKKSENKEEMVRKRRIRNRVVMSLTWV